MAPIGMIEVAPSNNTLTILGEDTPIRALRYFLWVDGKIILREAEGYFTTKKTAKDLQSFLKMTDDSLVG